MAHRIRETIGKLARLCHNSARREHGPARGPAVFEVRPVGTRAESDHARSRLAFDLHWQLPAGGYRPPPHRL